MGEESGIVEENHKLTFRDKFWGLRPWRRHSTIVMVAGIMYCLIGYIYAFGPTNPLRDRSLVVLTQIAPVQVWGMIFLASGVVTMISSRWPPMSEAWGYMVLAGISAAWCTTYLLGLLFYNLSVNLSGAVLWGLLAFMWWAISGLLNPDRTAVISGGGS
jgi:Mn2+/Fe2+ NRAMP family transporter